MSPATIYITSVPLNMGPEFEGDEPNSEQIAAGVEEYIAELEYALELTRTRGVRSTVAFERHGNIIDFETTDESVAREQGFDVMLLPGAEDVVLTPWKREGDAYRALIATVGEGAAKIIGADVAKKFPNGAQGVGSMDDVNEAKRAEAYETAARELGARS
jgi:hypothetical protein